jgi:A/G-specific adenine glycosylase
MSREKINTANKNTNKNSDKIAQKLSDWFMLNKRELPWRKNRDPYQIWISEIMLQQTTVTAVIPYFEKFMSRFPNVQSLANAKESDVLNHWAGLGYYSRARNLHKAAGQFAKTGFPKSWQDLIRYPGLGPYTSRAISSLAYGEKVGVIDGNVIRVLSRLHGQRYEWWKPKVRDILQISADKINQFGDPWVLNQAMMELGAMVCSSKSPTCWLCPLNKNCIAFKENCVGKLPLSKPRRSIEIWLWKVNLQIQKNKVILTKKHNAPFLKKLPLLPGAFSHVQSAPKKFDVRHSITHHDIYIQIDFKKKKLINGDLFWVPIDQLNTVNPSSMLKKIISFSR